MSKLGASSVVHIIRNALRLMDAGLMEHGERTAYILYKMLQHTNQYQKSELEKILFVAMLHDMGAYKTDKIDDLLAFDKNVWPHSVYGYLYFKHLSPFSEYAQIVLYHHLDSERAAKLASQHADVAIYLNLADKLELFLSKSDSISEAGKLLTEKYSPDALRIFYTANQSFGIIKNLTDGSYKEELQAVIDGLCWDQAICDKLLYMLVCTIDFKGENSVVRTVSAHAIARYLAKSLSLSPEEQEDLHYASLLYDIGMLGVPESIINAPRRLTVDEKKIMENHVRLVDKLLKPYVSEEIHALAVRHHEKVDGSGYLLRLTDRDLTLAQKTLAVADMVAALQTTKQYKEALNRDAVLYILDQELRKRQLSLTVVKAAIRQYDNMMATVEKERQEALKDYYDIKNQFEVIIKSFEATLGG